MIRCVIIDDEPNAVELLERYASRIDFIKVVSTFRDPAKALPVLNSEEVDVLFIDINMPGLTGMQLLQSLLKQPLVVFTTAYPEYAVESYDFNAVDYLVKPISFERFLKAINKADSLLKLLAAKGTTNTKEGLPTGNVMLKSGTQLHMVPRDEILFFEKEGNYVTVHTTRQKILVRGTITDVFQWVDEFTFVQTHKSYIVNLAKIEVVELHQVTIQGIRVPVGSFYRDALMARFEKHNRG